MPALTTPAVASGLEKVIVLCDQKTNTSPLKRHLFAPLLFFERVPFSQEAASLSPEKHNSIKFS